MNKIKKIKMILFVFALFLIVTGSVYAFHTNNYIEKNKTISLFDDEKSIKLTGLSKKIDTNDVVYIYLDDFDNEYIYKNNKIVGYFSNKKVIEKQSENDIYKSNSSINYKENAEKIAKKFIDQNITSFDSYRFENSSFVDSYNEINFLYTKYIDGFKTNDSINIAFNFDGSLASVSASRQGLFDKLKLFVTQEEINQYVKSYMNTNYPNLSYEILEMILDKENDQFMIKSNVVIEKNGYFTDVIKYIL